MEWGGGGEEGRGKDPRPALMKDFSLFIPWGEGSEVLVESN